MISVVVPVYNEEQSVALLYEELQAALDPLGESWQAVYVDDGSTDGSFAALTRLHARTSNVRVVRLRRNFGKAAALAAGFAEAEGDIVVTIDGDLQDDPSEIPRLLAKLDEGFDLASGWKAKRRDPLTRRLPSKVFNWVAGRMSGLHLHDMNCGLKAYRGEVVRSLVLYGELHRFIPVLAHEQGYRVTEVAVNHRPRGHGRSRYGLERYLRGFLDLLTVSFMGRYRHRPLHLFGGLGLLLGLERYRAPPVPDRREAHRPCDRSATAAHARRAARRRRDAVLHARSDQRDDHQPSRGACARAGAARRARGGSALVATPLRVLYFGTYERTYPRNAQVISCLRGAGVDVVERHVPVWEGREHKYGAGLGAAARLAHAELKLLRHTSAKFDVLVVGYPGQLDLMAARRAANGRPLVFNPLVSLADTLVSDRGRFRAGSLAARVLEAADRFAFRAADCVVADTAAHAQLFRDLGARRAKVCFVGAEERVFRPGWRMREPFTAVFVGKLIPLHGVETVLAAARLVPEFRFRVVGSGQLQALLESRPANVEWVPWVKYDQLPAHLHECGCALGIFGTSAKARRVIPNKVFQALACGAPVITADTPAIRELDGDALMLVPPGDAQALAEAVRELATNTAHRQELAAAGHAAYRSQASEEILGARWRGLLEALL